MRKQALAAGMVAFIAAICVISILPDASGGTTGTDEGSGPAPMDAVASIGDVHYNSLGKAIEAAGNGDEIQILKNIEVTSSISTAKAGVSFEIDLGGHELILTGPGSVPAFEIGDGDVAFSNGTIEDKREGCTASTIYVHGEYTQVSLHSTAVINETLEGEGVIAVSGGAGLRIFGLSSVIGGESENAIAITLRSEVVPVTKLDSYSLNAVVSAGGYAVYIPSAHMSVTVNINGGKFSGSYGLYVDEHEGNEESTTIFVNNGEFIGSKEAVHFEVFNVVSMKLLGGTYSSSVSGYLGYGYMERLFDGKYHIAQRCAVSVVGLEYAMFVLLIDSFGVNYQVTESSIVLPSGPYTVNAIPISGIEFLVDSTLINNSNPFLDLRPRLVDMTLELTPEAGEYGDPPLTLTASASNGLSDPDQLKYEWSKNGSPIQSDRNRPDKLTIFEPGSYRVKVTMIEGDMSTSVDSGERAYTFNLSGDAIQVAIDRGDEYIDKTVSSSSGEGKDVIIVNPYQDWNISVGIGAVKDVINNDRILSMISATTNGDVTVEVDERFQRVIEGYGVKDGRLEFIAKGRSAVLEGYDVKSAYDLSLVFDDNGDRETITTTYGGRVGISIPVPESVTNPDSIDVIRLNDDGTLHYIETMVDNGYVHFDTDHFSVFVLAVEEPSGPVYPPFIPDEPAPLPPVIIIPGEPEDDNTGVVAVAAASVAVAILAVLILAVSRRR